MTINQFDKITKDGKIWYTVLKVEKDTYTQEPRPINNYGMSVQSLNNSKALYKITYWDGYKFTGTVGIYEGETWNIQRANVDYEEPEYLNIEDYV